MIYVYQNGVVLGEFTPEAVQNGLECQLFSVDDWGWAPGSKEWHPLGRVVADVSAEHVGQPAGREGKTQVMPDLDVQPAKKPRAKNKLARKIRLK